MSKTRSPFVPQGSYGNSSGHSLGFPALVNAGGHGGTTLKVQAAWGGGIFLENAQAYVIAFTQWQVKISKSICCRLTQL